IRWANVSRARLLLLRTDFQQLDDRIGPWLRTAQEIRDVPLVASLSLIQCEAFVAEGKPHAAGEALLRASESHATTNPELRGEYHFTCGQLMADNSNGAFFHRRANAIWVHDGNHAAGLEGKVRLDTLKRQPDAPSESKIAESNATAQAKL